MTSSPRPPWSVSLPSLPEMESLPTPPRSLSSPLPPTSVSSPASPLSVVLPLPAANSLLVVFRCKRIFVLYLAQPRARGDMQFTLERDNLRGRFWKGQIKFAPKMPCWSENIRGWIPPLSKCQRNVRRLTHYQH